MRQLSFSKAKLLENIALNVPHTYITTNKTPQSTHTTQITLLYYILLTTDTRPFHLKFKNPNSNSNSNSN